MSDLPIDKPAATRIARRLAKALDRHTGRKPGHQTAMTLLAEALGHNSLHAFTTALDATDPARSPEALNSPALIDLVRQRGDFAYHLPLDTAAEIVTGRPDARDPDLRAWLTDAFDSLKVELDHHVNRTLRNYAAADGGPGADPSGPTSDGNNGNWPPDTPTTDTPATDTPMTGHEPLQPGEDLAHFERGDRAIDQLIQRGYELGTGPDGIYWKSPDTRQRLAGFSAFRAAALAACATLGIDPDAPCVLNHYRCPTCDTEWSDAWYCGCNDHCPNCNAEIEPHASEPLFESKDSESRP